MLATEWCKLDGKFPNVSPSWVMDVKVAGVIVPAMVTPWYEDGPILTYLQSAWDVSPVNLAGQVASGLRHLHDMGLVHGNVYPVMISIAVWIRLLISNITGKCHDHCREEGLPS